MAVELPHEFFTLQSMFTLTGAAGATFVIANGLQRAFNFNPRWLALVIAEILCLYGAYATGGAGSDYVVGLVNGFLVYSTAAGVTAISGNAPPERDRTVVDRDRGGSSGATAQPRRRFLTSWF